MIGDAVFGLGDIFELNIIDAVAGLGANQSA